MADLHEPAFMIELIRQLDSYDPAGDEPSPTGASVAAALGVPDADVAGVVRRLIARGQLERGSGPARLGDGEAEWGLVITPAGYSAFERSARRP